MTEPSTHNTVEQLLPAAALEILESEDLLRVAAHIRECAECGRQLESYREVVAGLTTTLPSRPLPPARSERLRSRLLARAGSTPSAAPYISPRSRRSAGAMDRWGGWAVAAGLAGLLLIHHSVHRPVDYGWLLAGVLTLLVLALIGYLRVQRARVLALEDQIASLGEPDSTHQASLVQRDPESTDRQI